VPIVTLMFLLHDESAQGRGSIITAVDTRNTLPARVSDLSQAGNVENRPSADARSTEPKTKSTSRAESLRSLEALTLIMSEFIKPHHTMEDLLTFLAEQNMRPVLAQDKNRYTGELDQIRTRNPMPGTRYFYAQFSGTGRNRTLNNISFDFEPSHSALSDVKSSLTSTFQVVSPPVRERNDFVQWELANGYTLWAKRLQWKDMRRNPMNAYKKSDVGTIRVTMEMDQDEGE
jgi:hypothetical protein